MATNSLSFPNLFNVSQNRVNIVEDNASVVNRTSLLILSEPTELYNEPNQGVGLKRHLWQYNNPNEIAIIKDRIIAQLKLHEPCVIPDATQVSEGLLFTGSDKKSVDQEYNHLKMTVALKTTFGENIQVSLNDEIDGGNS